MICAPTEKTHIYNKSCLKSFEYGNELLLPHKKAAKHWVLTDTISLNLKSHISITHLKNGFIKCPSPFFLRCLHSIPLALWPFITIAQQRFKRGRIFSYREGSGETQWGNSFPAWSEPPAESVPHPCAGTRCSHSKALQLPGKVSLAGVSLAVSNSRTLPKPGVSLWGSSCSGFS